jgi:transglutaminase-like putative cysteine protease
MRFAWIVMAVVSSVARVGADDPWDRAAFTSDAASLLRAAQALPPAEDSPVRVLLAETEVRFEADGRSEQRDRLVYRVESDDAREDWDTVDVVWAPWHQARPRVQARVITSDGRELALDPATIVEAGLGEVDEQVFSDRRQLTAPLPGLAVGAVVEQQTIVRDESPMFAAGTVTRHYLSTSVSTLRSRLVLDAPATLPLRFAVQLMPGLEPKREEAGGRVRLTFERADLEPFAAVEPGRPPDDPRWPYVMVSTGASWPEVARAYSELVDRQLAGADVTALARQATAGARDRRAIVQRLLARVDGVRYTSVQLGDAAFVPRTPRETLARGYGDCKDKATLLVALLRASGIPSSVALLSSGFGEDAPDLPGLGQFNHAIVHVPGSPELWIDPTVEGWRAGDLPQNDQGRKALVAAPATQALVRTPESTAADNGTVETREFHLAEMGPARVVETTEYRGAYDPFYRKEYAGGDDAKLREQIAEYLRGEYLAESLGAFEHGRTQDLEQPFRIKVEAVRARRGSTDERVSVVAYFPGRVLSDLPDVFQVEEGQEPPVRESPYCMPTPHFVEHRYRIVVPPGYAVGELPAAEDVAVGPARYQARWSPEGNGVLAGSLRFESGPRCITAGQFNQMREGVRALRARPVALVRFEQTGEAHLTAGRVREALAEFGALAEKHPKEALHRTQRALAMLSGGLGEAARAEARRAVEVEPASALAHRRLGWVLQHDLVGRRLGTGADVAGAQAAYRKALERDPKDVLTRTNLAYLLEFDEKGEQYGPGAKLDEAAELYWHLAHKDGEPYANLCLVLLRAGRVGELAEAARLLKDQGQRDGMEVLAAAAQDGVKAAVARAARIAQVDDRRRVLMETADFLLRVRRYADAAALLQEAAQGSPNASQLRARIEQVARLRAHAPSNEVEAGPEGVVRTFMRALMFGWDDARVLALVHPDERSEQVGLTPEDQLLAVRALFDRERRKINLSAAVFADIALSNIDVATEGDDRFGYRVRFRNPQVGALPVLYVVKHGQEHVVLGTSTDLDALGREALRRADAGDAEGGRRLLDWAREQMSAGGDDPFAVPPLVHFWTVGQPGGVDEVRQAAASLLLDRKSQAERGVAILQAARAQARDDVQRAHFDHALQAGYASLERWADVLAASDRLGERLDTSASLRMRRGFALFRLGQLAELRRLAEERQRAQPSDLGAARLLRLALVAQKDHAGLEAQCGPLLDGGRADANDHNECAWNALFLPPPRTAAIERARRGAQMARAGQSRAFLHTLATLYASEDQSAEAYGVILDAMKAGSDDAPRPEDWFVFGRMAETYGLPESAAAVYRRVTKSEDPISTWALARERLAALEPAVRPAARKNRSR